jgi:hypothetical protein
LVPIDAGVVLVHDFAHVQRSATDVRESLTVDAGAWLADLAERAWDGQRAITTRLGPGDPLIRRTALVGVGPVRRSKDTLSIGLHWQDATHPGLFPTLDADLIVTPLGDKARLEIMGRYEPPLGVAGRVIDDALLHGLAESTVRAFLTSAVQTLDRAIACESKETT